MIYILTYIFFVITFITDLVNDACPVLKYWSGSKSGDEKNYQRDENIKKGGPERKLSRYQEFLLTLLKLRLNLLTFFLADIFGVSPTRVSQVYTTWINVMSSVFSRTIRMPDRTLVKKHMTPAFKKDFPDTTAIIDCTEIPIEKPRQPKAQSLTYSSYKSRNTLKALVSITPTGAFNFISDLWGGNTSDRYITKESGFLDCVRPGDEIMADRGFLIRDLLLERRAKLVIPPFTKKCKGGKGKRLLNRDIFKTRKIAKHRIQVERAIQRLKTFKLLSDTMPVSLQHVANPSLKVAGFICNLNRPLVK